jgi:anion-transporting  ArsA/GET3 family ATPase
MSAVPSLLERRLIIVTGKGGTGKSTVTAALALATARAGLRVLAAEMGRDEALVPLLDPGGPPAGYPGREVAPGLDVIHIDPYEALAEYLGLQLGGTRLIRGLLRNQAFHQLMQAAPGWRELITLGKIWHLEQMSAAGKPRYDLIVVDAPATGHGVALLNVPRVVVSAVRTGPLRRHSQAVEEMLEDPVRTVLLPVAIPEELPTRETAELVSRVREELGIAVDRVVVNGVVPPPFPPGLERLDERLGALPSDLRCGELPPAATLAQCAAFLRGRHELGSHYVREIGELTGLPLVCLPHLPDGAVGGAALEQLAAQLLGGEAP